jgi:transcriptional regulator with XRE-family HTH domain
MNLKDFAARFKKTREGDDDAPQAIDHAESYRIRARMVGVLIRDARLKAARSLDDCARLLRLSADQIEAWEYGDDAPTLPQLELLAYYLDVPISHFWGVDTLESARDEVVRAQDDYLTLRQRMIGALVRMAREETGLTLDALSEATGLPTDYIARAELGEIPLPMHELSVLSNALKKNMRYFLESSSHLGEWLAIREEWKHFTQLPDEVRRFAANPRNLGFIEIAIMLSQMPADRLRRVGESVLNITM